MQAKHLSFVHLPFVLAYYRLAQDIALALNDELAQASGSVSALHPVGISSSTVTPI